MIKIAITSLIVSLATIAIAQEPTPATLIPKIKDYKLVQSSYEKLVEEWDDEETFKALEFKNLDTKEIIKFKDMSQLERSIFLIMRAEKITKKMEILEDSWKIELIKVESGAVDESNDEALEEDKVPSPDQIKKYIKEMRLLRRKMAVKFEAYISKVQEDQEASKKQITSYLKEIIEYHNEQKLVERNE